MVSREISFMPAMVGVIHFPILAVGLPGFGGASSWWSNISLPGGDREASGDWFSEGLVRVIENGLSAQF